ncbi:Small RNA degrading nuclease 3 [Raphanus sativus]|nr:Small RNA degrading nuclease 3 [Raphanus sativus]
MGLSQKMVQFKLNSGSVSRLYVRKNVQDGEEVSAKKRSNTEEEKNVSCKRQKRENDSEETTREENGSSQGSICEDHIKEIEELKEKLKTTVEENEELKEKLKAKDENEELKEKLKAKEREVEAQDKMITNLKKKLKKK